MSKHNLKAFFYPIAFIAALFFCSIHYSLVEASELASIELPSDFQYPNGIARSSDGTLYVGSITSGQILRINSEGQSETLFPGSDEIFAGAALRLDEQRNILWGTSPDFLGVPDQNGETRRRSNRIFAIDSLTGEVLRVILMPDAGYGNDIALDTNGGVYVTDSTNPRIYYLAPEAEQFSVWVEDTRFSSDEFGLSGIARRPDGVTIVGMYSDGELFKITPQTQGDAKVEPISLERELENPDGIQFTSNNSLLVAEGAATTGEGRLLEIDIFSSGTEPKSVKTIGSRLESPTNLTVADRKVWVTESRIRRRILPNLENEIPEGFFVRSYTLTKNTATSIPESNSFLGLAIIATSMILFLKK